MTIPLEGGAGERMAAEPSKCGLTECQGRPMCKTCFVMFGLKPPESAPSAPLVLPIPTRRPGAMQHAREAAAGIDLVDRLRRGRDFLREHSATIYDAPTGQSLYGEAADEIERLRAATARREAEQPVQREPLEASIRALLWEDHPECCGSPVVGAEYMGQQEMVCCGCPEPSLLNDKQIVASLRAMFPERTAGITQEQKP